MTRKKDDIYQKPLDSVEDFVFDEKVAEVFDDMLNRSIPGYQTIIRMISVLAQQYAQDDSIIYDLGCSHGPLTALLKTKVNRNNCKIIAVDNSPPLLDQCQHNLGLIPHGLLVEFLCEDVCHIDYQHASLIVMNFILQFVEEGKKQDLLQSLFNGLKPGGALILSEKIFFEDAQENDWQVKSHHNYKRDEGYSDLEVRQKQESLINVLTLKTIEGHKQCLKGLGFQNVYVWYQCFNFISVVGVK